MNLSIKGKLMAASLAIIALVSGLIIFLLGVQKGLENQMKMMIQNNLAAIRKAEQIKYHVVLSDDLIFRYLTTDDRSFLTEAVTSLDETQEWIDQMKSSVDGQTEKEILGDIESQATRYREGARKLIKVYQTNKSRADGQKVVERRGFLNFFSEPAPAKRSSKIGKQKLTQASAVG